VANYVKSTNAFEQDREIARDCPHCGAHARLVPISTPDFGALAALRPTEVGVGFSCSACGKPRFGRLRVQSFEPERIVLSANVVEIERAKERFQLSYLPDAVRRLFREALECYAADCHNAFGSMCRRTARVSIEALGQAGRQRWSLTFDEAVQLGDIDDTTAEILRTLLFSHASTEPEISPPQSAILIEIIKDILYQCHVRSAKFKAAIKMRRYFAEEGGHNVTSLINAAPEARSA
jgi:predicted RNA-binding Zn-ribbon protein involved in translation (DUF1610 family)